jgi:hypothetical protein
MGLVERINRVTEQRNAKRTEEAWNRIADANRDLRHNLGILLGSLSDSILTVHDRLVELAEYVENLEARLLDDDSGAG